MLKLLKTYPWFIVLLPVFFALHGYAENFNFLTFKEVLFLTLWYIAASCLLYLLTFLVYRNLLKAALFSTTCLSIYLFYGAIVDFLKDSVPVNFIHKHSIIIAILSLLLLAFAISLKRTKRNFEHSVLFINCLFVIFLLIDIFKISQYAIIDEEQPIVNYRLPEGISKPDIYFLVFDEYTSSASLKERFKFNNNLDSILINKGFRVLPGSRSNYNYTPFSIASILNMDYLPLTKPLYTWDTYSQSIRQIKYNKVIETLEANNYQFYNYSIFDINNHPSPINQSVLPLNTNLITAKTLLSRLAKDFRWYIAEHKFLSAVTGSQSLLKDADFSLNMLNKVKEVSATIHSEPRFIYAHLNMPHEPFLYDRNGDQQPANTLFKLKPAFKPSNYTEYVLYTNDKIKDLVSTIQKNTQNQAVIIIMGDHGFRYQKEVRHLFPNFNAVYLPNQDYTGFYDSATAVNQFRMVFNSVFNTKMPMLADSTIFLVYPPKKKKII